MKKFKWLLNWSLNNLYTNDGDIVSVWQNGKKIGTCRISIEEKKIVGNFSLDEDIDNSLYVLYMVSIPDSINERYLEGIILLGPEENEIEKRSKRGIDMEIIE